MTYGTLVKTPAGRIGVIESIRITDTSADISVVFGTFRKSIETWPHYLLRVAA